MFNKTIGLNIFRELYEVLLGLEIIMDNDDLNCDSQWPKSIHVLAILINLFKYKTLLMTTLRCLQDSLLRSGVEELLNLIIALSNSSLKNHIYFVTGLLGISSSNSGLTWWSCAKLIISKESAKDH